MTTLYDHTLKTITGESKSLGEYQGKVVLVVNVASACGATPQYAGLQKLYDEFGARGLVVAGVPANDFGAQEPGSDTEIKTFCESRYHVTFPMFAKTTVKGNGQNPLYTWLTSEAPSTGDVKWNFEKFLVGRDGKIAARFDTRITPDDPAVRAAIEKALG